MAVSRMIDEIDTLFAGWARADSPGAAVSVIRDGEILLKRGYGMANLDHDVPIAPSSIFHSASVSKQFTAMAVYLLAEEGGLSLDDDVRQYVTEVPDFGMPITLDHLIHHTSGLRDQWELLMLSGWRYSKDLITDEDVLRTIERQRVLNFPPGARFMYCNTGYTLLARVVASISGQSFRRFTSSRIFEPLKMTRTFFRDRHGEVIKGAAYGYHPHEDGFDLAQTNLETVGATSMLTTVEDLARWDENFRSGRVGGRSVFERMHRRGVLSDGSTVPYGGGVGLGTYRGLEIVEHTGGDAGFRSNFMRFPHHGLSVAILSNLSSIEPPALSRRIADICLRSKLEAGRRNDPPTTPRVSDPERLARMAGLYLDPEDGDESLHLHFHDGKLRGGAPVAEQAHELTEMEDGRFRYALYPRTEFVVNEDRTLSAMVDGRFANRFIRSECFSYSPQDLEEFAGIYVSPETVYPYEVVLQKDGLASTALKHPLQPMRPLAKDLFIEGRSRLRFTRDAAGAIRGLLLNTDRLRNVWFERL
ncbi:serine hydrolase domain-containing protein [Aquamicrobium sp. LC103]|uniref:serine hydrolase domain-containing protein n=1 Tax=Aquamicrobium sp. LC103 TaxID=1120658 RepID=UPI00063E95C9|nr:serine hydrolase domain-containing protein [Aquamicrobium sp. LC103]